MSFHLVPQLLRLTQWLNRFLCVKKMSRFFFFCINIFLYISNQGKQHKMLKKFLMESSFLLLLPAQLVSGIPLLIPETLCVASIEMNKKL